MNLKVKCFYNKTSEKGLILVDILIAMSLAVVFVVVITQSVAISRNIFEYAKERNRLLDVYELHAAEFEGMMPYESRTVLINGDGWKYSTTTINAYAHWYGNDRIETDIVSISNSPNPALMATTSTSTVPIVNVWTRPYTQSLTLNSIRTFPFLNVNDAAGTPLCSVDFTDKEVVGTYGFMQKLFNSSGSYSSQFNSTPNPQTLDPEITAISLPLNFPLPMTDFQVRNGVAYISSDSTTASDHDVSMLDIHDAAKPLPLYSFTTGPGLAGISLAGNHIYAAVTSRIAQLQVIQIPYIGSMSVESSYKLPLSYATETPALGSSVFYDTDKVYLGTEKWDGQEFNIIDVSNPAMPIKIGGFETNSKVGAIYVRDGIAYVTASDDKQLRVIDVRNPASPILLNSYSPSGWERQEGKVMTFFEDSLGWGRTSGGFNIKNDYELFTMGSSTISSFQTGNILSGVDLSDDSIDISGGVYGIVKDRSFVYVATRQTNMELQIFDQQLSTTTMKSISLPTPPQTLTCDGESLYVLSATAPVIYKISFK